MTVVIHPHLFSRLRTRWFRRTLTRLIAMGADPGSDESLGVRARNLTRLRTRRRIAGGLEHVVETAERRTLHWTAAAPLDAKAVLEARTDLIMLATRLKSPEPVNPCGVAQAELLLSDYESPLQNNDATETVREAARRALAALDEPIPLTPGSSSARGP